MKKVLYLALAVVSAITGVMVSKANSNQHKKFLYKYIGPSPTAPTLVTNVTNWTAYSSIPSCNSTEAACYFINTIPTLTIGTRHIPSANIDAAIGATISGVIYYVPIKRPASAYTYLVAFNQPHF